MNFFMTSDQVQAGSGPSSQAGKMFFTVQQCIKLTFFHVKNGFSRFSWLGLGHVAVLAQTFPLPLPHRTDGIVFMVKNFFKLFKQVYYNLRKLSIFPIQGTKSPITLRLVQKLKSTYSRLLGVRMAIIQVFIIDMQFLLKGKGGIILNTCK